MPHSLPRPLAARSPRVRGNQAKCLDTRRSTALARAATNAEHPQLGDPAGFRCCVTRTPRNRAERGDIGVFEGEAREEAFLGSQERPLFGTGVVTPLPPRETRRSVPDRARDGATTHQMRHHGRRAGGAGGAGGKACSTNCSRPSDSFNHP